MPENNLPELRDIHLPDGVSAFPPAYGWWIILAAIVAAALLAWLFMVWRRKSKKRYALFLLQSIDCSNSVASAAEMSVILRRICVFKYKKAAALSGRNWLDFLNAHTSLPLAGKAAELLLNAPYMPPQSTGFEHADVAELCRFCRRWIGENL